MLTFAEIHAHAIARKGGEEALQQLLPQPLSPQALAAVSDDRCLATITKIIFSVGFARKVVEAKWPGFETAFCGFHPAAVLQMDEDQISALLQNTAIIRNRPKIMTVQPNAAMILELAAQYGSFAQMLAQWPGEQIIDLWALLKNKGSRLGGNTGSLVLRTLGKDTFMLSNDVVTALQNQALIGKNPHSKSAQKAIQGAFNTWQQQSGLPLCQISRILACTVGENYLPDQVKA